MDGKKLVVIGLDCAAPQLIFDEWRADLPALSALMERGTYRTLFSTIPPITVPAWMSMMTSKDGGQLGLYGFRNRKDYSYDALYTVNASNVKEKTVWNYLAHARLSSLILSVPLTYPPKPLNGVMAACFLTPDKTTQWTYPPEFAAELDKAAEGDYIIDVKDFRTENKDQLLEQIYTMTRRRFKAFRHFVKTGEYDFAMMVEMGVDRIHHGFWRFMAKDHRLYEPGHKYENAIHDYYVYLDEEVEQTLDVLPAGTEVMIVSDHGAKTMKGAICINEWLMREGLLTLKEKPAGPTKFSTKLIDWSRTKAWGEGGYYSRIFMNVKGREPQGVVPADEYEEFRDKLMQKLEHIEDEKGVGIGTVVFKPKDIYFGIENIPPDLIVHLGNLDWRSAATVGTGSIHMFENDTGPDDANHAMEGTFITSLKLDAPVAQKDPYSIFDIAPTILDYFGLPIPEDMIGETLLTEIDHAGKQPDQLADKLKAITGGLGKERERK
jgi:predicted AlkP superfamily phosphohydrolase/phosphomutase